MSRVFVAIELPREPKDAIVEAATALAKRYPEARWVARQHMHLTLVFLGNTSFRDQVNAAVSAAAAPLPPMNLKTAGLGAFPSAKHARVLWAGIEGDVEQLAALVAAIEVAIEPLGFEPEKRDFTPHVTLARFKIPAPVDLEGSTVEPVSFRVSDVTVFESRLLRSGPVYTPLASAPLLG